MRQSFAAMLALLMLTACSPASKPAVTEPPATEPPAPSVPVASKPTTLAGWNDLAFTQINAQRWAEAIEAAQEAIALDGKSSAAHFNLGRAYLGAGKAEEAVPAFDTASTLTEGANADVEFYRGRAREAANQLAEAVRVWADALEGPLAGDQEIAAALEALLQKHDAPVALGDVDMDARLDLLRVDGDRFRITSGTGQRRYDGEIMRNTWDGSSHIIRLYPLSGEPPLIHVEVPACASAPLNTFFWFDPEVKEVRELDGGEGPCSVFLYVDDHRLENGLRAGGVYLINELRFEAGAFQSVGRKSALMWLPTAEVVEYYLTSISAWPMGAPEELFLSTESYEQFMAKTKDGSWIFEEAGPPTAESVQLKALKDGKEAGLITVFLEPAGEERVKIARILWP